MSERKDATGVLAGITEKPSGWSETAISLPGKDYPLKMSTKKQELVELARAAGENVMVWTYTEQDSGNPNPHRPGTNYVNRYFEGVMPTGSGDAAPSASPGQTEGAAVSARPASHAASSDDRMSKEEWARKDAAIHRTALLKAAADVLRHTLPAEPTEEDLGKFSRRAILLSAPWYSLVLSLRDDGDDGVPF